MDNTYHTSVMLTEALDALQIEEGKKYIDGTLGGGGHTKGILQRGGIVLGIDTDEEAIRFVKERIKTQELGEKNKLTLARGNFKELDQIAKRNGFGKVSGILFDLGVSSHQFDEAERGFSFQKVGPLDMRMSNDLSVKASDLINGLSKKELVTLFEKLGEEYRARLFADRIVKQRKRKPIVTTTDLAELIMSVVGHNGKIHPATKVFQALRIAVNDELHVLREALKKSVDLLLPKGQLVVISFHSLEDRIVKESFKKFEEKGLGTIVTSKPLIPDDEELRQNRRSRSAKMRVFQKLEETI